MNERASGSTTTALNISTSTRIAPNVKASEMALSLTKLRFSSSS